MSEAERNAFNEERRIFEAQRKAFELEKSKKEKELAEKTKELKDRETFLELREENKDDAADLFDLSERQTIQHAEDFYILREEKEPYEIEKQNEEGMTIKAKSKDPNIVQSDLNFEIAGHKQPFRNLEKQNGELFVSGKEKEPLRIEEGKALTLLPKEKAPYAIEKQHDDGMTIERQPKPKLVSEARDTVEINAKKKEPYQKQIITSIDLREKEREKTRIENTNSINLLSLEKTENQVEYGDWLKILTKPKPKFEKTTSKGFTVGAVERNPYETQYTDAIELAYEEPKKTENTITSGEGFEIQAKPNAKADKPNLTSQHSHFSIPAGKKVKPTVTDAFKTPSKKKGKSADSFKGKNKQTKYEMYSYSSFMYEYSDLVNDLIEEDEESEKEEKIRPESEKVSAFTLDEKPVAKNKISNTESIQILKKKEKKPLLSPMKTAAVEVKATKKQPPQFEISQTQPITVEAQTVETKKSATEPQKPTKFGALKLTKAVSGSIVRTKDTWDAKVQTAGKVSLSTGNTSLFIKGEKPSKDLIIDLDEDEAWVSEKAAAGKVQELFQIEYPKLLKSVRELKESVMFVEQNADVTETLSELRKKQQTLLKKMDDFEKTFNNKRYFETARRFVFELGKELDAVETMLQKQKLPAGEAKTAETNKTFKPGWSVLALHSNTTGDTFKGKVQPKFFQELRSRKTNRICFIGKSAIMKDAEVQAGEPKVSGYLQPQHTHAIGGDGSETEKLQKGAKEAEVLKEKLQEFDGMDREVVKHFRGKTMDDIVDVIDEQTKENTKELTKENERLKQEIKMWQQEVESKQKALEEENDKGNDWWNAYLKESDEVERLKKLLLGRGRLNPGAEVPKCEDPEEYERAEKLYGMMRLLNDLFICIANKSLTREALNEARKNFEHLKEMYTPCACESEDCEKLRKERKAYIDEIGKALKNAERFLPSDLWEARTSEMFLSSKPKAFSPSKPKKTNNSVSVQTDVKGQFFEETEAEHQTLLKQIADLKEEKDILKEDVEVLKQISTIQGDEEAKTEAVNQELLEQIKGLQEANERLRRENKQKLEELEKRNKEKDEGIEELKKCDAQSTKLFQTACSDDEKLQKELKGKNEEIRKYQMLLEGKEKESEKVLKEKDVAIKARKGENRDLEEDKFFLEFKNKALKDRPGNEGDEKKNSKDKKSEKLPEKPTDLNKAKEVDDFRKRLKEAGDSLRKLEGLKEELKSKPDLNKLEEAVKNAKERKDREEKFKKEAEKAEKEMNDLMQRLKNTRDVDQLKKGIAALLDCAQKRLSLVAGKFGLEDAESFVKKIGNVYGNDVKRIAQKNVAGSFVHTVSLVQESIMEVLKRITVILKPKALPMEVLSKATADEEKKKINSEAEIKKRKVVQEKDAEIAKLKKQLEEMERNLKQQALDARIMRHMKGKTETNLLHETNVSPLYNFNDTSDVRDKKKRDDGRRSTPYETPGTNKLRGTYAWNADNYSRDDSQRRSVSHPKTLLKGLENSDLRLENYNESQIKSDKTFETLDKKQQMPFTDQRRSGNFLGSIEETKKEIHENGAECMLPKLRKAWQQVLDCLNSDYWKNDVMWDKNFETQNKSVKEALRSLLEYIEKKNKQTPVLQKSVTEKKLKTAKAGMKTRSRLLLSTTEADKLTEDNSEVVRDLEQKFNSENSDIKNKETKFFYREIDPKNLSGKKKLNHK